MKTALLRLLRALSAGVWERLAVGPGVVLQEASHHRTQLRADEEVGLRQVSQINPQKFLKGVSQQGKPLGKKGTRAITKKRPVGLKFQGKTQLEVCHRNFLSS